MNEVVSELYRKLMQDGFKNAGALDNPTIFIDSKAEGVSICGQGRSDFMNIYVNINENVITDIRYLCSCDPTANVVIETLCGLARGQALENAKTLSKEQLIKSIGGEDPIIRRKAWGAIELLNRVIKRYEVANSLP
jgi:NifU-like protein involved in Fe-S cluster formation